MTPERWQQVKTILEDALELDAERREGFPESACGADAELRDEVTSLLAGSDAEFLDEPAVGRPPPIPESAFERARTVTGSVAEVRPVDLPPYTRLVVSTKSSRYDITVVAPLALECLITGGRRFANPTRARLLRHETIAVGEVLRLGIGTRKITTTPIERIEFV